MVSPGSVAFRTVGMKPDLLGKWECLDGMVGWWWVRWLAFAIRWGVGSRSLKGAQGRSLRYGIVAAMVSIKAAPVFGQPWYSQSMSGRRWRCCATVGRFIDLGVECR